MKQDLVERIAEIEDRQAIEMVIYRYCRAMDRGDADLMRTIFWEDGGFGPGKPAATAKDFVDPLVAAMTTKYEATHHSVSNILVELNGSVAFAESYATVYHRTFPNRQSNESVLGPDWLNSGTINPYASQDLIAGVRYCDRFQKRGPEWRIAIRNLIFDWTRVEPSNNLGFGALNDKTLLGRRGERDYSNQDAY